MNRKILGLVVLFVAFAACGGKGGETLVSINGKDITEGDLEFLGTINPRIQAQIATPFGKKQILDNLVEQELLYQAALKKGLQRDPSVKTKIDLYKRVIISQSFLEDAIEAAAKEYYDKNKTEFEKLQLSHILIKFGDDKKEEKKQVAKKQPKKEEKKPARTKEAALELANKIKARIEGGEDFATVAKETSEDGASKASSGDLGKVAKNEPRFERRGYQPLLDAAFAMQVGTVQGPIETKDGFHIITVTKGVEVQSFDEIKQGILFKLQSEEKNKVLADLKKNAKIVYAGEEKKEEKKEAPKAAEETKPDEAASQSQSSTTPENPPSKAQ